MLVLLIILAAFLLLVFLAFYPLFFPGKEVIEEIDVKKAVATLRCRPNAPFDDVEKRYTVTFVGTDPTEILNTPYYKTGTQRLKRYLSEATAFIEVDSEEMVPTSTVFSVEIVETPLIKKYTYRK